MTHIRMDIAVHLDQDVIDMSDHKTLERISKAVAQALQDHVSEVDRVHLIYTDGFANSARPLWAVIYHTKG